MQKTIKIYGKEYTTKEGNTFTRYSYTNVFVNDTPIT